MSKLESLETVEIFKDGKKIVVNKNELHEYTFQGWKCQEHIDEESKPIENKSIDEIIQLDGGEVEKPKRGRPKVG